MCAAQRKPAIDPIDPRLLGLYRQATPTQKLEIVARINASLHALKTAQLRSERSDLLPSEQMRELRRWWFSTRP